MRHCTLRRMCGGNSRRLAPLFGGGLCGRTATRTKFRHLSFKSTCIQIHFLTQGFQHNVVASSGMSPLLNGVPWGRTATHTKLRHLSFKSTCSQKHASFVLLSQISKHMHSATCQSSPPACRLLQALSDSWSVCHTCDRLHYLYFKPTCTQKHCSGCMWARMSARSHSLINHMGFIGLKALRQDRHEH